MRGLFSKPVSESTKPCQRHSKWIPTQGLGIRLDTSTRKTRRTIGTWIRDLAIVTLCVVLAKDQLQHAWEDGYRWGHQAGFKQGMEQKPQVWKSSSIDCKIQG